MCADLHARTLELSELAGGKQPNRSRSSVLIPFVRRPETSGDHEDDGRCTATCKLRLHDVHEIRVTVVERQEHTPTSGSGTAV